MNHERFDNNTAPLNTEHQEIMPTQQGLPKLKALFWGSWFALGNMLLLIGGDDSVEIGLQSHSKLMLTHSTISLSGENNRGQNP
jgi:hypothetical protein